MSDIPAKIHPHNLASGESSDEEDFNLRSVHVFTEQFEPSNLLVRFTGTYFLRLENLPIKFIGTFHGYR